MIKYALIGMAVVPMLLTGCATIISGTNEGVTFNSSPEGASVYIDGQIVGTTPLTVPLPKMKKKSVMVKKDGYEVITRDLGKQMDPVAIGNIIWDLSTTDFISGALMEYEPKSYYFELEKK
ncbi:MAG: PEGA domain-containing protein [Gammaproteobacteria bacterium]|nr:PEGA domain-containing protein [Gammaproteobacteria bacterium]